MAQQRSARLVSAQNVGANARLLEFSLEDELGFTGGQYIIVNTGIPIAADKVAKRAYSILSGDIRQHRFQIAVRRIGAGPGSNYMFDLPLDAELAFSGPWGKYLPREQEPGNADRSTLILATDTGITAAIGLVSAEKFAPYRQRTNLFWITESDEYFLPESFVRERISALCGHFEVIKVPTASEQRESWLSTQRDTLLNRIRREEPATAFLSGDGFLLAEFRNALESGPYPVQVSVESFFHHQELKTVKVAVP
jgi:ferredoxin-NADP reductase